MVIQILVPRSSGKLEMSDDCLSHMALTNAVIFVVYVTNEGRAGSTHCMKALVCQLSSNEQTEAQEA